MYGIHQNPCRKCEEEPKRRLGRGALQLLAALAKSAPLGLMWSRWSHLLAPLVSLEPPMKRGNFHGTKGKEKLVEGRFAWTPT